MPPQWFNSHGMKMVIGGQPIYHVMHSGEVLIGSQQREGDLTSTIAQLQIRMAMPRAHFKVSWRITFAVGGEWMQGDVHFSKDELKQAFNLLPHDSSVGDISVMKEKFDAEKGVPGHFIRKGKFLNVPMPGTGMDGDPNISIFITDEMQEAVRKFISSFQ